MRHDISMHITLLIHVGIRQRVHIDLFVLQPLALLLAAQRCDTLAIALVCHPSSGASRQWCRPEVIIIAVTLWAMPPLGLFRHRFFGLNSFGPVPVNTYPMR